MPADSKRGYVKCVYDYLFDGTRTQDTLMLYDPATRTDVGKYTKDGGLVAF
jgi:hypothetical protein